MAVMEFHTDEKTNYFVGVDKVALFVYDTKNKTYKTGVPVNGAKNITDKHEGGEAKEYYGDNVLLFSVPSNIKFNGSIETYGMPEEFDQCVGLGGAEGADGLVFDQQSQVPFGLVYRNNVGDKNDSEASYDYHFVWMAKATPGEISHDTIEEDIDIPTLSYDYKCVPTAIKTRKADGSEYKPMAHAIVHTKNLTPEKLKQLEDKVYGTESTEPTLPTPDELLELIKAA